MVLLGELGCFAYYFNSIAWFAASGALRFSHDPLLSFILLIVTSVLAVLVSKLLLKTIDIHFSEQSSREKLLPQDSEERESALSLPFLLRSCLPDNCLGGIVYLLFLVAVLIALLRTCTTSGLKYYGVLVDNPASGDDLALQTWAVAVLFVLAASFTAFFSYQSHQYFQIVCIFLNVLYAISKVTNEEYVKERERPSAGSVFPRFVSFLSIELLIPSVMAVSKVSSERHGVLIPWAVGLVAALYLIFALLLQSGSQIYVKMPDWVREAISLPCLLATIHIIIGALVDLVVAWRYGLNVKVAQQHYPKRVQAVRLLLPFAFFAFCFFFSYFEFPLSKSGGHWVLGALLTTSVMMFAIPYCHKATHDIFATKGVKDSERWWRYAVYAGGVGCVAIVLYYFLNNERFSMVASLEIDAYIIGVFVLWQLIGQCFN